MLAVLTDKCEGEARTMVQNASECGGGVEAFMRVHEWFVKVSGLGLAERRNAVMVPNQSKKEEDLLRDIEKWKRDLRDLEIAEAAYGSAQELPPQYKLTALKRILTGKIKEHIRVKESELEVQLKETGHEKNKKIYEIIEKEVYSYVKMLRIDMKTKKDEMEIDGMDEYGKPSQDEEMPKNDDQDW